MENQPPTPAPPVRQYRDAPSPNDRLLAALGYPFWFVALIALLLDGPKDRPFTRYHAIQALGTNVAMFAVAMVIFLFYCVVSSISGLLACLFIPATFLPWLFLFYFAYLTYTKMEYFEVPVVTDLMQQQGWLQKPM